MIMRRRTSCFILSLFFFSACAVFHEAPERTVRVRLLADSRLMEKDPRWRETAAGLLHAASDFYGREFGLRFVAAGIAPWELEETSPFVVTLMKQLMQKYPAERWDGSYDMIVALTGGHTTFYMGGRGMTNRFGNCREGLGNYIVATVTTPYLYSGVDEPTLDAVALIHEFGHVFGAAHVSDPNSIMNESFDYRSDFDAQSSAVVMQNKFCPFAK